LLERAGLLAEAGGGRTLDERALRNLTACIKILADAQASLLAAGPM
jgi:hypothetical protein